MRTLNGASAGCLQRFTGKSRVEEAREATCSYNLCKDIRRRRLSWLGHILRSEKIKNEKGEEEDRLIKIAVRVQQELGGGGSLLMDAPTGHSFEELVAMANDRATWKQLLITKFGKREAIRKVSSDWEQPPAATTGRWFGTGIDAVWIGPGPQPNQPESQAESQAESQHTEQLSVSTTQESQPTEQPPAATT